MAGQAFEMGPDLEGDLRFHRPYFLLTLLGSAGRWKPLGFLSQRRSNSGGGPDAPDDAVAGEERRLQDWARTHPVTDVFILSHGWHRNLLGAVSAYDRLLSRYALLWHSGRLPLGSSTQAFPSASPRASPSEEPPAEEPLDKTQPAFQPLFIGLHWHSDPGEDGWVDGAGRRSKASFLRNVEVLFRSGPIAAPSPSSLPSPFHHPASSDPPASPGPSASSCALSPEARLVRDFEELFEVMSQISAPGKDAVSDRGVNERIRGLTRRLQGYELKVAPQACAADKVTALWRCYFEAEPQGVFLDQSEGPQRYLSSGKALLNLAQFVLGVLGLGLVLGPLLSAVHGWLPSLRQALGWLASIARELWAAPLDFVGRNGREALAWLAAPQTLQVVLAALALLLACLLFLLGAALYKQWSERACKVLRRSKEKKEASVHAASAPDRAAGHRPGQPLGSRRFRSQKFQPAGAVPAWVLLGPWLYAQLVCTLLLLAHGLASYTLGGLLAPLFTLVNRLLNLYDTSDERLGGRNRLPSLQTIREGAYVSSRLRRGRLKHWAAGLARLPLTLAQHAASGDSGLLRWTALLDSYLAFFDMQGRAVEAGALAARNISRLVAECPSLSRARLHFIGHSFGGLLVCNAVRHLALDESFQGRLGSLCLLQGALASNWFEGEEQVQQKVPVIASIYSRYDSANGFYYPVANAGRYAAGYVGLLETPGFDPQQRGFYASLVRPPELGLGEVLLEAGRAVVNVDASRLINGGTVASGGGHSLIYRDDVLHLIWALVRLSRNQSPEGDAAEAEHEGAGAVPSATSLQRRRQKDYQPDALG